MRGDYIMWTRKELKEKAKEALKRNYWKIVLVAALPILLSGGFAYSYSSGSNNSVTKEEISEMQEASDKLLTGEDEALDLAEQLSKEVIETAASEEEMSSRELIIVIIIAVVIFTVVFCVVFAIRYAFTAFLYNPALVGVDRFMLKSVDDKSEVKEIVYAFDHSYLKIVKTMFFKDLYVCLWTLLFIIPGVYKKYQYRMVPYILAEYPEMDYKEVLQRSKDMMQGEKWHAFVLDVTFIPWHVLGFITCGILEIFYIAPYQHLTNAELYRTIDTPHEQANVQYIETEN